MLWGGIGWVEKSEKGATVAGDVRMLPILPLIATCILLASPPKPSQTLSAITWLDEVRSLHERRFP